MSQEGHRMNDRTEGDTMKRYTHEEMSEVLRLHKIWLDNEEGGVRADLRHVNLRHADLRHVNLRHADLRDADLRYSDLRDADLSHANLRHSDLSYSDLRNANLFDADLSYSDLRNADLRDADLSYSDLRNANLFDADLRDAVKAHAFRVFSGLYEYECWPIVAEDGTPWVRMGCLWKTVAEWDEIGIRNSNKSEYPDDGSEKSERRVRAFEYARAEAIRMAEQFKAGRSA